MENKIKHIPVLVKEVTDYLALEKGMTILDCTVGMGGHAEEILSRVGDTGYLIGIDRDFEVLKEAKLRLSKVSNRFRLFHSDYRNLDSVLKTAEMDEIDGAIFDLGASSFQMENAERGFSIKADGPLDMRMDTSEKLRAADIINKYSKPELIDIFEKYGDEYFAGRIAERIVRERKNEAIETTGRLADIVQEALPYKFRFRRIHPATKVFMALRMAVNKELEGLETGLLKVAVVLKKDSRLCVIAFHSAEDRVVKNRFKEFAKTGTFKIITKKPIQPSENEVRDNPRSRSAKLRVAEKMQREETGLKL
ncbi:MAG: 16S rRNA (cytosine(1402)-N(4))-methyltransferase RsmH [Candidatus Omnitrophica bacterium]|nr:16S rRNA (cytosine(1402)-N(4))-methyltransferase RsmH [Candidatus Omnitrophota bacterium]